MEMAKKNKTADPGPKKETFEGRKDARGRKGKKGERGTGNFWTRCPEVASDG